MFDMKIDITVMSQCIMCNCKLIMQDADEFNISKYNTTEFLACSHKHYIYKSMSFDVEHFMFFRFCRHHYAM